MLRRCARVGALVLIGLAIPASANAADIFGSDLTLDPSRRPRQCTGPGTGPAPTSRFSFHTGNTLPTTGARRRRDHIGPLSQQYLGLGHLAARSADPDQQQATGVGTGPTATLEATGAVTEVPVNPGLPVQPGDYLAGDGTTGTIFNCTPGTGATASFHLYEPPLVDGDPFRARSTQNTCEILVQATIEPDADADRLGDDNQDTDTTTTTAFA